MFTLIDTYRCNFLKNYLIPRTLVLISLLLLIPIQAGCQTTRAEEAFSTPMTQVDLCGLRWNEFEKMNENDLIEWIETTYGQTPSRCDERVYGVRIVGYCWETKESINSVQLQNGHPFKVRFYDIKGGPQLGQIVTGLGTPETVDRTYTSYEKVLYTLTLDYSEFGVTVDTWSLIDFNEAMKSGRLGVLLEETLRVDAIDCYAPTTVEGYLRDIIFYDEDVVDYQMKRRIPWPGFGTIVPLDDIPSE